MATKASAPKATNVTSSVDGDQATKANPTMVLMALDAIQSASDKRKGMSVQAIKSFILDKYPSTDPNMLKHRLRTALNKCMNEGHIKRVKSTDKQGNNILIGKYRIKSDSAAIASSKPNKRQLKSVSAPPPPEDAASGDEVFEALLPQPRAADKQKKTKSKAKPTASETDNSNLLTVNGKQGPTEAKQKTQKAKLEAPVKAIQQDKPIATDKSKNVKTAQAKNDLDGESGKSIPQTVNGVQEEKLKKPGAQKTKKAAQKPTAPAGQSDELTDAQAAGAAKKTVQIDNTVATKAKTKKRSKAKVISSPYPKKSAKGKSPVKSKPIQMAVDLSDTDLSTEEDETTSRAVSKNATGAKGKLDARIESSVDVSDGSSSDNMSVPTVQPPKPDQQKPKPKKKKVPTATLR